MHSPYKGSAKKTRKSTFNQTTVSQTDVGDFSNGYFVMPDPVSTKENDYPLKSKTNSTHIQQLQHPHTPKSPSSSSSSLSERSPSRRKQQIGNNTSEYVAPSSPMKERSLKGGNDLKKPHTVAIEFSTPSKKEGDSIATLDLLMPSSFVNPSCPDSPSKLDIFSTSPSAFGRWAGPAFGNAPHPSTLPLPEFPMFPATTPPHTPKATKASQHSVSSPIPMPGLSSSPVHNKGDHQSGKFQQPTPQSPPFFLSASPPPTSSSPSPLSVPVVPFPYVSSHVPHASSSPMVSDPSLAQLSTDLRRLLNINAASVSEAILSDPVLVSASSS